MKKKITLLEKIIPAAEALIRNENFSIENLCHAVDCGLKELGDSVGSMDDLVAHVNDRFLQAYLERAAKIDQSTTDDFHALRLINAAWLDHAQANPQSMNLLLQHHWSEGYERPEWYAARINACFGPAQRRLAKLAPKVSPEILAGISRGIYAHICGLYFLSANERTRPAGINSIRKLLDLQVSTLVKGLQAQG